MLPIPFAGGLVLFDQQHQRLHLLNAAAAMIWTLLNSGLTDTEAAAALASHTGRDRITCADDIAAMQEQWAIEGTFGDAPIFSPQVPVRPKALRRTADVSGEAEASVPLPSDGATSAWYDVGGVRVELSSEDEEVAARVAAALGECVTGPGEASLRAVVRTDAEHGLALHVDGARWLTSDDAGDIVGGVFHLLLQRRWGDDDWLTMIHGAALERDGAAVVMPGKSGSGKTTLAAYLSRRGFGLLADDLAAVRADGTVVPWPTWLNVKRGSWRALADTVPELDMLPERDLAKRRVKLVPTGRAAWDRDPAPVRALVLPRWSLRTPAGIVRLDPLETLASLVEDRVWVGWPMTQQGVRTLLEWLERVPAWRLWYPDLHTAETQVLEVWQAL